MKSRCLEEEILKRFKINETADMMATQIGTSEPRDVNASESPPSTTSQSKSGSADLPKVDLFVGNLSLYTDAATLKAYFE